MEDNNKLKNLVNNLSGFEPELRKREELLRDIMEATSEVQPGYGFSSIVNLIFSWADYAWIRRGLVAVSLAIVLIFMTQQFSIINRIDKLEKRMVQSNTQLLLKHQGENVIMNSAILISDKESDVRDSILVADRDLRELIDSYTDLQKRYQDLQKEYRQEHFDGKTETEKIRL